MKENTMSDTNDDKQEQMIDKVIKLLSKAESTTPEEAESLAGKAQELMTRYAIDSAMLAAARGEKEPDKIVEKKIHFTGIYATSHQELAFSIGYGNEFYLLQGHGYTTDGKGKHVKSVTATWVGFETEIRAAELLLASLLIQAERFQRDFMKAWNADHSWATAFEKATARRSFLNGFATGIQTRLQAARRAATNAAESDYQQTGSNDDSGASTGDATTGNGTPGVALVLADRKQRVNDWVDEHYGHLKAGRARQSKSNWNAHGAGRSAAANADIGGTGMGSGFKGQLKR